MAAPKAVCGITQVSSGGSFRKAWEAKRRREEGDYLYQCACENVFGVRCFPAPLIFVNVPALKIVCHQMVQGGRDAKERYTGCGSLTQRVGNIRRTSRSIWSHRY